MITPGFSTFRKLLDDWDLAVLNENLENQIQALVNSPNLSFLFTRHGEVFGAGEDARVTFAKLKSRKKEDSEDGWKKDADFMGVKLNSIIRGDHPSHSVFSQKDLKDIKVIDQKEAKKRLLRNARQNDLG